MRVSMCQSNSEMSIYILLRNVTCHTHVTQAYCHMYEHVHVRVKLQDGVVWQ